MLSVPVRLVLLGALLLVGCGRVEKKDIRFSIASGDSAVRGAFTGLIASFNEKAGFQALSIDEGNPNSYIGFVSGLYASSGEVGRGQWLKETSVDRSMKGLLQKGGKTEVVHGMRLQFDEDYLKTRLAAKTDAAEDMLFLLFCHEVGHGLHLDHDLRPASVMYPEIGPERRDYGAFFTAVSGYFD